MPLPGGPTDKFGNRYEGHWTVYCMIDVMDERANAIRLEPPGAEGEGIEFWVRRGDKREYHQVKRQHSAKSVHTRLGHFGSPKGSAMMVPLESTCTNVMWFDLAEDGR